MTIKCRICKEDWNVSVKSFRLLYYICPICSKKKGRRMRGINKYKLIQLGLLLIWFLLMVYFFGGPEI